MSTQYPPSGALFTNEKKSKDTQPDYTGNLELSDEVVNDLVDQMQRGIAKPKIDLAGWKRVSKNGRTFLSIIGNVPYERKQNGAAPQQQAAKVDDQVPF